VRLAFFALSVFVGCSSSEAASTPGDASGDVDEPVVPAESCVRPGDNGNEKGVGTYCSTLGHECDGFAGAPSCLADLGQKQWMCTRIGCTKDDQCGTGATCLIEKDGSACVPNRCLDKSDGGTDAETGSETGGDTGSETGATDASDAG
jgi:hypothetical protein